MIRHSKTAKARQYVLIELQRNMFRENTMNDIRLPKRPIETTEIRHIVIAMAKSEVRKDIFF